MTTDKAKSRKPRSQDRFNQAKQTLENLGVDQKDWFPRQLSDVDVQCWSSITTTCYATIALVLSIIASGWLLMNDAASVFFLTFMVPELIGVGWWAAVSASRTYRLYSAMNPVSADDKAALFKGGHAYIAKNYQILLPLVGRSHLIEDDVQRIMTLMSAAEDCEPSDGEMMPAAAAA